MVMGISLGVLVWRLLWLVLDCSFVSMLMVWFVWFWFVRVKVRV